MADDTTPETGPETSSAEPAGPSNGAAGDWTHKARERLASLEAVWKDIQHHQGFDRLRTAAGEVGRTLNVALADANERLNKLAAEARDKGQQLAGKAQSYLGRDAATPRSSADEPDTTAGDHGVAPSDSADPDSTARR